MAFWHTRADERRVEDQRSKSAESKLNKKLGAIRAKSQRGGYRQLTPREQARKQRALAASMKRALTPSMIRKRARRHESPTLTPGGKSADFTARDIYRQLEKEESGGLLRVEGLQFEKESRVMDAIHELAKKVDFGLRKQARADSQYDAGIMRKGIGEPVNRMRLG